jgi:hypothetical protein
MDHDLDNLLGREPQSDSAFHMPPQLVLPLQYGQNREDYHFPVFDLQGRPLPNRSKQSLIRDAV